MRRGEALGLRWEDVDLDRKALSVTQQISDVNGHPVVGTPKTKRGTRLVPIDELTVEMLRLHRKAQLAERSAWGDAWKDSGLVFTREDGTLVRPEYATRRFQALAARLGLPTIRLHDLRHTHASLALAAGVELKAVSERLGHSQIAVTADLYTQVPRDVGQAAAEKIAAVLRGRGEALPASSLQQTPNDDAEPPKHDPKRARPPPAFLQVSELQGKAVNGADEGTRTPNHLFTRQVRCQLRHVGNARARRPEHHGSRAYPSADSGWVARTRRVLGHPETAGHAGRCSTWPT